MSHAEGNKRLGLKMRPKAEKKQQKKLGFIQQYNLWPYPVTFVRRLIILVN